MSSSSDVPVGVSTDPASASSTIVDSSAEKARSAPPSIFKNGLQETGFLFAVLLGQAFNLTPFGATLGLQNLLAERLGVAGDHGQITWILSGFSLTTGSFVLIGGKLGDTFGARIVWLVALVWIMIWNLVSGFATGAAFYDAARGLAGIGAGMMLPTAIGLLATAYPPGRNRNLVFGVFGALAPISAAGGSVFEILIGVKVAPEWAWWLHAFKNALTLVVGALCIPRSLGNHSSKDGWQKRWASFDFVGSFFGLAGLILFNFAFIQSLLDGWNSASVLAPLLVGLASLIGFGLWESKFATNPVLPFDIWRAPTFGAVIVAAFLDFMSFGIFIGYYYAFQFNFRGATPLQGVAYIVPFTLCAGLAALLSAYLISRVPAQVILSMGLLAMILSNVLLATAPPIATYWTHTFFAAIFAAFGPDLTFTAAQLISSNTVKPSEQGVAGSMVGTALNYGLAMGLALGGVVETHTDGGGDKALNGMRGAEYLGIGMAILGLLVVAVFVRVPKDQRDGYDVEEEK